MIYVFIDESGDIGNPEVRGNSQDFSLAACICRQEDIEAAMTSIKKLRIRLKRKEIKISKLSSQEIRIVNNHFKELKFEHVSVYGNKNNHFHGRQFLKHMVSELMTLSGIDSREKVKVFVDGNENAFFRKIYAPTIKKHFPHSVLKFVDSIKTPLIQAVDFYAGQRRRTGK